jgi:diketogulonate reductase-like aldo/keto reductase
MVQVPNIKLSSGHDMPQVGFGLWKVDNAIASDVVYNAIKAGYRLFDGACGMLAPRSERKKFSCGCSFGVLSLEP